MNDKTFRLVWNRHVVAIALLSVIVVAVGVRGAINFSAAIPPGIDAAYYPLQARSLLEHGKLAYADLPLIFVLDAALARALMLVRGVDIDGATLLASRIVDSVAQPFVTVAIFALGLAWAGEHRRSPGLIVGMTAAAAMATISFPVLFMTGNFEKNSLGLLWLAGSAWASFAALSRGGWARWVALLASLTLSAITHVGTFGATALLVSTTLGVYVLTQHRTLARRQVAIVAAGVVATPLLWLMVYLASARRAVALVAAPRRLFLQPAGGVKDLLYPVSLSIFFTAYLVGAAALYAVWRDRKQLDFAQIAVVIGAFLTTALLACPLINGEYFGRLSLMTPIPAAVVLVFITARRMALHRSVWPVVVVGTLALGSVAAAFVVGGPFTPIKVIPDESANELRNMRALVTEPEHTVVAAEQGLMWWAGYFLATPVREHSASNAAFVTALEQYDHVFILTQKEHPGQERPGGNPRVPSGSRVLHDGKYFELYEMPAVVKSR